MTGEARTPQEGRWYDLCNCPEVAQEGSALVETQAWKEQVERVAAGIGIVGNSASAFAALAALTAQMEERDKHIASLGRMLAQLAIVNDWRARAETAERERDNWHASNYAERQARLKAERDLASSQQAALLLHKRVEELERIRDSVVSKTALDVVAEKMAAEDRVEAAEQRVEELEGALERVRENAKSWHGPVDDHGHAKALAVIALWCDAALAARTEDTSDES